MCQIFALALEERGHGAIRRWHLVLSARSLEQALDMLLFAFKVSNTIEGFNYYRYLGTCQAVSHFRRDHVQNLLLGPLTLTNTAKCLHPRCHPSSPLPTNANKPLAKLPKAVFALLSRTCAAAPASVGDVAFFRGGATTQFIR